MLSTLVFLLASCAVPRFIIIIQTTNTGVSDTTNGLARFLYSLPVAPVLDATTVHTRLRGGGRPCVQPVLYVGFSYYSELLLLREQIFCGLFRQTVIIRQ